MEYFNTQSIADQLKALVRRVNNADQRGPALAAIRDLENAVWHPKVFAVVLEKTPGAFEIADNRIVGYTPPADEPTMNATHGVVALIEAYLRELDYTNGADSADSADALPTNITRLPTA